MLGEGQEKRGASEKKHEGREGRRDEPPVV